MITKENGELKLTFERKFNYGEKNDDSLQDSELFVKDLKEIYARNLKEFEGTPNGYYEAINRKLHFLKDLK